MTRLQWGLDSDRVYASGIDRGVLYIPGNTGVVWNGLISVEESYDGGERQSRVQDGVTYLDEITNKTFQAKIEAFSAPIEFAECLGERSVIPGFALTRQPRSMFGLSYRTQLNVNAYQIHIIYNAVVAPAARTYSTISNASDPTRLAWSLKAIPSACGAYRPTAHIVLDSRKISTLKMTDITNLLYGMDIAVNSTLPTQCNILDILVP